MDKIQKHLEFARKGCIMITEYVYNLHICIFIVHLPHSTVSSYPGARIIASSIASDLFGDEGNLAIALTVGKQFGF